MTTTITVSDAEATTTLISTTPDRHNDESSIVTASAVVGFILVRLTIYCAQRLSRLLIYRHCISTTWQVGLTGLLVSLKVSRWIRIKHQHKRFSEWNAKEHHGEHPKGRLAGRYNRNSNKGKNAFDVIEDDEGIPA